MILISKIFLLISFICFGMAGGQRIKGLRRFGIPGSTITYILFDKKKSWKLRLKYAWYVLLTFTLSMGYGESSWLRMKIKNDKLTRVAYGFILSIPFLFFKLWYAPLVLAGAFSIRAGSIRVGDFDFLFEDFYRYTALGILILITI